MDSYEKAISISALKGISFHLTFNPDVMQNYQKPTSHNVTECIDKECIIVTSAGDSCHGHYLVDDLPRIRVIKDYLGDVFYNKKFIISTFTPKWVNDLLKFFFGLNANHFYNLIVIKVYGI